MGMEVNGQRLLLGRGKLYFDRLNSTGARTGELFLGNCPAFEITPSPETIEKYSSATAAAGQIASDVIRQKLELRIQGDEFSKENLASALYGDTSTLAQTGSSVTAEEITAQMQDRFYPLVYRDVSSVVVTGTGGTPTYTEGTDYEVDATSGRIYIIEGGGIAASAPTDLEVDYDYGTIALDIVRGMNQTTIKGYVRFVGDPARGPSLEVEVWRASVRSDGAIGFISDEYGSWQLVGEVEDDSTNHPDDPHYRIIKVAD
jgi:hypothetical protein